jgi:ribosome-associated protein
VTGPGGRQGDRLEVNGRVSIPLSELTMRASRAGGPGGQHVNTSSTRIEVEWTIPSSRALGEADRERLLLKLASRLDSSGTLRIVSAETRSQAQNRERALARLAEVVRTALVVPKVRRKTKPSKGAKEQRLAQTKRRSAAKQDRRWSGDD